LLIIDFAVIFFSKADTSKQGGLAVAWGQTVNFLQLQLLNYQTIVKAFLAE